MFNFIKSNEKGRKVNLVKLIVDNELLTNNDITKICYNFLKTFTDIISFGKARPFFWPDFT